MLDNGGLVNATDFNHDLDDMEENRSFLKENYGFISSCQKCEKCNLIIVSYSGSDYDYFFLNEREVFTSFLNLQMLNLTCEELQIKLLLE